MSTDPADSFDRDATLQGDIMEAKLFARGMDKNDIKLSGASKLGVIIDKHLRYVTSEKIATALRVSGHQDAGAQELRFKRWLAL